MKYDFDSTQDHRTNGSWRWGLKEMPSDVIGMGTADLDYTCAPCIREALIPIARENCYNYRQHSDEYFDAVIGWYGRNYGLTVEKEWLSDIPSTIGAVRIALCILTEPGDGVIVQTPVYVPVARAIEGSGCRIIANPLKARDGHFEIDFEDFETKLRKEHPAACVIVNPHNPTGKVYKKDELEKIVDLCYANNVKIVTDEVHCMVTYDENKHIPILAVSDKAQEISVQVVSMSKGYNLMSLPHAIITIANPEIQKPWHVQLMAHSFAYAVNSFAIAAVTTVMRGDADEWLRQMTAYLRRNREEVMEFIRDNKLPLIPYRPEGGFLIWIDCTPAMEILGANPGNAFMEKAHIHLDDGEEHFGREGKGFVRINFAVTNAVLKEALDRIRAMF